MADEIAPAERWPRWKAFWSSVGAVTKIAFHNLAGVRGLTGIFAIAWFCATAIASWLYNDSTFGKFSQVLGFPIGTAVLGIWIADFYYRRDAYAKRFRDVLVSVYTTQLLITGVQTIKGHIATAGNAVKEINPSDGEHYEQKLTAHAQIEAASTAANLTLRMAYMAITNLELFSSDAVISGKEKFAKDDKDAGELQMMVPGSNSAGEDADGGSK
ncbi:hypothetical protein [Mycolicibacterium sp. P9-22]|uniref:hypothetical protein n=1 Tax=Mycolicibacterium sp. P9-22 TaxID=2024613 RepID=UPI0011EF7D56|nr:hypothetical protein [Mycolicibacterium sp. P9-22]